MISLIDILERSFSNIALFGDVEGYLLGFIQISLDSRGHIEGPNFIKMERVC